MPELVQAKGPKAVLGVAKICLPADVFTHTIRDIVKDSLEKSDHLRARHSEMRIL
ncbi:MAG: hypothetical protein WCS90_02745 [Bacilli bacterium]